jgi:hypothetical protein
VNLRTVTRGDAAVAAAALLLLISSFLPYISADSSICISGCSANAWHTSSFPLLPSVFFLGVIGAALILVPQFLPQEPKPAGIRLSHWGIVLTVASFWSALWALLGGGPGESHSIGAYLAFLFALVLAGAAVGTPMLPQLSVALLPDASQQPPGAGGYPPYGQQPGQPHPYPQQGPGAFFHHAQPVQQAQPGHPFTGPQAPQYGGGYGYPQQHGQQPQPGQSFGGPVGAPAQPPRESQPEPAATPEDAPPRQDPTTALLTPVTKQPQVEPEAKPQATAEQPQSAASPQPGAASEPGAQPAAPAFAPYWFAVPAVRPLSPEQGEPGAPVGELVPGTWYLAIAQRGDALLTQTQEGKRGLLTDTSGIQRG